jgi:predicted ABC-type ATPase
VFSPMRGQSTANSSISLIRAVLPRFQGTPRSPTSSRACLIRSRRLVSLPRMATSARSAPRCIVIAGPNGAGKTTFAREFLAQEAGVVHFVNPDLIASGLSPLRPELAAIAAGRIFLRELDRLAKSDSDFAFESTLSGLTYVNRLQRWKTAGRRIEIVYLRISSPTLGLRRIAARVKQGGHNVPRQDVVRRFSRSWKNFERHYRLLADAWSVYDNSGKTARWVERSP